MRRAALILCCLLPLAHSRADAGETIELQYWDNPNLLREMQEIFEQYERENPGVKVLVGQSAARNLVDDPQRVMCAIVGGAPPDIIRFDRYAVGEWASRGAFLPLDEFLEEDLQSGRPDAIKRENYFKPCWDEAMYNEKLYGIPIATDNRALLYNKDMLIKHGYTDEKGEARPPKNWTELREYARKLSVFETVRGERVLKVAGFVPNYGNSWLYLFGWQNGAKFMSDDGRTCLLNEPAVVGALEFMKDIYDDLGGAQKVNAFQSSFQPGELDPFLTGKIAMVINGNWVLKDIATHKPDMNFGVCPAPMPDGAPGRPISWLGGWAWVIPKGAKHPREAWELIRKLSSVETAMQMAEISERTEASQGRPYIPPLNANADITQQMFNKYLKNSPRADPKFVGAMQVFIDLLPDSRYRPVTPVGQLLWNWQKQAMEDAILAKPGEGVTPQSALDNGAAIVQRELDRLHEPDSAKGAVVRWDHMVMAYITLLGLAAAAGLYWMKMRFKGGLQARAEARAGYAFAFPWLFGFVVFTGGPILCSLIMSFCTYDAMSPSQVVGLRNFKETVTTEPLFWPSIWNTLYMVIAVPLGMAFGLGVAMLLNAKVKGMAVFRTFFYLPAIVPGVASALLWILIFNPNTGLINWALATFLGIRGPLWLNHQDWSKPALILQGLWGAGAGMIVWLAGLKAIPEDLYEAAAIDGAGALQRFRHITIPMLTPYIFFNLVMGLIGTFQIFLPAYIMTQGGPKNSTMFYAYNLFNHAFRYMHMGYASALAWILFAIVFAITLFQTKMSSRWVHYQGD